MKQVYIGKRRESVGTSQTMISFFFSSPHYQIRQAAREMGERAFKERLKQIKMSEYDAEVYMAFYNNIKREVQSTRVVLDSLQAKGMS